MEMKRRSIPWLTKNAGEEPLLPWTLKIALAVLILLEIIAPFTNDISGVDAGNHLSWIHQFHSLLSQGVYIPRWLPKPFYGFGATTFYFYPPLTYYLASFLSALTGITNAGLLFQATGLVATIASFFTALFLLRSLNATVNRSILGSAMYAFAPYRIAELYSMSSLSSHVAYIFIPLVCSGLLQLASTETSKQTRGMILLAISSSLLILTNIPITILIVISILITVLAFANKITTGILWRVIIAVFLTVCLSGFFLASILEFKGQIHLVHLTNLREYFFDDLIHRRNIPGLYHLAILYAAIIAILFGYWHDKEKTRSVTIVGA